MAVMEAIIALVEDTAGMMFFTTPCVSWYVTPAIPYLPIGVRHARMQPKNVNKYNARKQDARGGAIEGALKQPLDVFRVVAINRRVWVLAGPQLNLSILDAVLGQARTLRNRALGIHDLRWVEAHITFKAICKPRQNHLGRPL